MYDSSGYLAEDTIAALATAPGGALGVVRVSGPAVREVFSHLAARAVPEPRRATFVRLRDPVRGSPLDEGIAIFFPAPFSFTGEDVLEFQLHGGAFSLQEVLRSLFGLGVRQALPGEFSFRAVRNGKLTILQAQAVSDLIQAGNSGAVQLALEKLAGSQDRLLGSFAEELRHLAVLSEVGIDFADQDVEEVALRSLQQRVRGMIQSLERVMSSVDRGLRIQEGVRTAFIGLPNAGKSSFFNAILGEDRSIVSDLPGTTRDVVHERLNLRSQGQSVSLRIEDTAGLRETSDPVERIGIDRTERAALAAELRVLVVAATASDPERQAISALVQRLQLSEADTQVVISKWDLVPEEVGALLQEWVASIGFQRSVRVDSVSGAGIEGAVEALARRALDRVHRDVGEVVLTRQDQVVHLQGCRAALERSLEAPVEDLFAADVRQALVALEPLIGKTPADEILGRIFAGFCIGK